MQRLSLLLILFGLSGLISAAETASSTENTPGSGSPGWEFGLSLGLLSVPHYRGSDQRAEYAAPVPYVRFRGNRLKVDREGGRYYFLDNKKLKLDLSAAFSLPVDSEDNRARQGMPDLDAILEAGPRLQYYLWHSKDQRLRLRLAAPLRMAVNLSELENEGFLFAPYFQVRYYSFMETALSLGPMWASEKYHDYYYQVDSQYATASRPVYDARAGYSGFRFTLTNSHRLSKHYWWGGFLRYDRLDGARFEDSPLVKQKEALMLGFAFAYIFNPVKAYYDSPFAD